MCIQAQAQRQITGRVMDEAGELLIGVNVFEVGTSNGAVTDINGTYTIRVTTNNPILRFTYVGFQELEVKVGNQGIIDVSLTEDIEALDEVVVIGYGSQTKATLTGSISQVSTQTIERVASPTLSTTLGGMMPGMITRQSSGEPGYDSAELLIRGIGTWTGNRQPLVLVDGVERDINIINSQEIESFTILKDASATAVYGVRGANGVILINTKRGKIGKPKVTLRTEFANLTGLRFPDYINGYEFASLMNEAVVHGTGSTDNLPWSEGDLLNFKNGSDPYSYPSVNWTDEVLKRNAFQTINNLSISGGNDIVRYFVNVGYTMKEGLYKRDPQYKYNTNSMSSRYNFRSNVDVNLSKELTAELGLGGIIEDRTYPGHGAPMIFNSMKKISPINFPKQNPDGSPGGGVSYLQDNPWALSTQSGYDKQFRNTLQGTFRLHWDLSRSLTEGLSVAAKFSYDFYYFNSTVRRIDYEVKQYLGRDEVTGEDRYNVVRPQGSMGYYTVQDPINRSYYYETAINYERRFDKHLLSGLFLFNRNDHIHLSAGSSMYNLPYRRQGWVGRATYDFDHRYLLEFNFGFNGSENFPEGSKYGFFPSASTGWVISNEQFWNQKIINHLKIRGSYGLVGNDQIGGDRFLFLSSVNKAVNGYFYGMSQQHVEGWTEDKIGVSNVTWETAKKLDLGFDLEMFNGIVSLQADYFNENREGILLRRGVVPNITGMTSNQIPWANLGKVKNRGFDGKIEIRKTTDYGLYYMLTGNATFARNKIIEDDSPIPKYEYQNTRGKRIDQPFGLIALGFFEDQEDINDSPRQNFMAVVRPGDIKYKDVNNDGVIDDFDKVAIGYARTPELMYGFGGTIAYNGFDMTLNFTGAARTSTFLDMEGMYPFQLEYPNYNVMREYYDNRWIDGVDNSDAKYPAVINGNNPNNYRTNTLYLKDAGYLRLKVAEIGYNFKKSVTESLSVQDLRLFVNGTDLLTFDKLKVIDPESNYGTGGYPRQSVVNFGAQINF
ncbi:MAG: TonB-dependent receptor [bacterium]|nr:TonB-dependent receptor [bacterium]MDD3968396.1 TonB-dependent receptor [Proteiniphilum sp.]